METIVGDGPTPRIRIDDLDLDHLDFLKVDVEGYELFVLKGAEQTLLRHKPVVILEENIRGPLEHGIENGECGIYLASLGARLVGTQNKDLIFSWHDPLSDRAAFLDQFDGADLESPKAELRAPIRGFIGRDLMNAIAETNVVGGELSSVPRRQLLHRRQRLRCPRRAATQHPGQLRHRSFDRGDGRRRQLGSDLRLQVRLRPAQMAGIRGSDCLARRRRHR
jgi:hypothetical protein